MTAKILLVERKHANLPSFGAGLIRKDYDLNTVKSGSGAIAALGKGVYDLVVVNAASMRTTGKRICSSIQNEVKDNHIPIILIVENDFSEDENVIADVVLVLPFTLQKLVNRIKPFEPSDMKNIIERGPLLLDMDSRCVHKGDIQMSLTPRLAVLLQMFMEQPGVVIPREVIFRRVWETDFIDDMRTLDVHISWLRQVVEADPKKPKLIKTVRGKGYKLVIDG
jgi:DNA-binding response OmpR family regulator